MSNKTAASEAARKTADELVSLVAQHVHPTTDDFGDSAAVIDSRKLLELFAPKLDSFARVEVLRGRLATAKDCEFIVKTEPFRCHSADDVDFHSGCVQTRERIVNGLREHIKGLQAQIKEAEEGLDVLA